MLLAAELFELREDEDDLVAGVVEDPFSAVIRVLATAAAALW